MSGIRLYSAKACPFAHRTRLVLTHKQLDFELIEIDLQNKPAWYGEVSLYGKVPALEHAGHRVVESAIINEYIDEVFPDRPLSPGTAFERAQSRIWIDYANTKFVQAFGAVLRGSDLEAQPAAKKDLLESLAFIEHHALGDSGRGPFLGGTSPSLVDFALYPWFERWPALEHYRGVVLPRERLRLKAWVAEVSQLPAVQTHANPVDFYVARYARFASAK